MSSAGRSSMRSVSRTRIDRDRTVVVRQSYYWPDQQLNFWILVMIAAGGTLVGVFASFIVDQQQLRQGIPWIMPYGITVGSLTVVFIFIMLGLIYQRRLLPGVVMIGSFILLVLYITGIIETAIQLFGPAGDINGNCNLYVFGHRHDLQFQGPTINTLAWLQQNATCQSWLAVFAFWIIGAVFLVWMMVLGSMVARGVLGDGPVR